MLPVCILAGGMASRLGPAARQTPKILMDIHGVPFAERQIAWLRAQGVREIVYCVGHLGDQIIAALGAGSRWQMRFRFIEDGPELRGTGGAVRGALPYLGDAFFVLYGDSFLQCSLPDVARAFETSGQPALMTVLRNDDKWDRSNVEFEAGRILVYDKTRRRPGMRYVDYGLGVLTPAVFAPYPSSGTLDLATVYRDLAAEGRLAGCEVFDRFYEIGSPEGLAELRALLGAPQSDRA